MRCWCHRTRRRSCPSGPRFRCKSAHRARVPSMRWPMNTIWILVKRETVKLSAKNSKKHLTGDRWPLWPESLRKIYNWTVFGFLRLLAVQLSLFQKKTVTFYSRKFKNRFFFLKTKSKKIFFWHLSKFKKRPFFLFFLEKFVFHSKNQIQENKFLTSVKIFEKWPFFFFYGKFCGKS